MLTHANGVAFVEWAVEYFGIDASDRLSGHPPLHFDLSVFDIFGSLAAGSQLHLVSPQLNLHAPKLVQLIRDAELTQWFSVPSVLGYLAKFDAVAENDFPALRRVIWCGEALPTPTLIHWMKRLRHVSFTNLYGPTETTVASSYYTVPSCPRSDVEPIPIGEPCTGEELLVLDDELSPAALGEDGDLYIAGAGLSPGYWRDPEKTAASFIPDPRGGGGRIYRTGDRAQVRDDGLVYFLGRSDAQIKSRGYRIELGEIEAAPHAFSDLREAAVVAIKSGAFDGWTICAAFVPQPETDIDSADLRTRLLELLPAYMVPSRWHTYPALPKNANGKIDKPALRERFSTERSTAARFSRSVMPDGRRLRVVVVAEEAAGVETVRQVAASGHELGGGSDRFRRRARYESPCGGGSETRSGRATCRARQGSTLRRRASGGAGGGRPQRPLSPHHVERGRHGAAHRLLQPAPGTAPPLRGPERTQLGNP